MTETSLQIPGFEIEGRLGQGGMGTVYRARQVSIDRPVAIKVLDSRDETYIKQFRREAKAVARLNHPNIVRGIDVGEIDGTHYLIMEFIDGVTLHEKIQKGKLSEKEVLEVGLQMAEALEHASRYGFVHRDIKPKNIIITPDGTAKLCDLGLARSSRKHIEEDKGYGTAAYLTPEQIRRRTDLDVRTDIYALGVTLYQALAGDPPFLGTSKKEVIQKHLTQPPTPIREWRLDVSEKTGLLLGKMMQKDRILRHQTATELVTDLREILEKANPRAPRAAKPEPKPASKPETRSLAPRSSSTRRPRPKKDDKFPVALVVVLGVLVVAVFLPWGKIASLFGGADPVVKNGDPTDNGKPPEVDPKIRAELRDIELLVENDPEFDRSEDVLAVWKEFRRKHRGTKWETHGWNEEKEYKERADEKARPVFESLRTEAQELVRQSRLREAIEVFGRFPQKFHGLTQSGSRVLEEITRLQSRIKERYAQDGAEIRELLRSGRFDQALDILEDMEIYATEILLTEISERKSDVRKLKRKKFADLEREIRDFYYKVEIAYRRHMKERKFRMAAAAVATFLFGQTWDPSREQLLQHRRVDYEKLKKAYDDWDPDAILALTRPGVSGANNPAEISPAEMVLMDLRNAVGLDRFLNRRVKVAIARLAESRQRIQLVAFQKDPGYFELRDGKLVFLIENKKIVKNPDPLVKFLPVDLITIAETVTGDPEGDGPLQFWSGLLHFYAGISIHTPRAASHLALAVELHVPGAALYRSRVDEAMRAQNAVHIRSLLDTAKKAMKEGRWEDAERELKAALAFEGHPLLKSLQAETDGMLEKCGKEIVAQKQKERRFGGTIKDAGDGRVTVTYDFSQKEQLDAFQLIEPGRGKWRVRRGGLERTAGRKTSALLWRFPVKGDVVVEYDLTAVDTTNISTTIYYNKEQNRHYSFSLGLDIISGTKDPLNVVEDNKGMPRNCIVKYPVKADYKNWVLPAFWKNWKNRLVGKAVTPFQFDKSARYRVRAERTGKTLRFKIDDNVIWEGEDDSYNEGMLLLQSGARVEIDNLSITFRPTG